jgi:hypothetical protein
MSKTRAAIGSLVVLAMVLTACSRAPQTVEIPRASEAPLVVPSGGPSIFQPAPVPSRDAQVPVDPNAGWSPPPAGALPSPPTTQSPSPSAQVPAEGIEEAGSRITVKVGGKTSKLSLRTVVGEPMYLPPAGALKIAWSDLKGNTLVVGGTHMADAPDHKRPPDVGFELTLAKPQTEVFSSSGGKCRVTLTKIRLKELEGEFTCRRNQGDKGTVIDVSGRFFVRF